MILLFRTINGTLEYRIGDDGGENWTFTKELSAEEAKNVVRFPIVSIADGGEVTFDFSILEIEKTKALEERKKNAIEIIKKEADNIRNDIVGDTSPVEREGWVLKAQIAKNILAGTATAEDISAITYEVALRDEGETIEELATKQILKSNQFALATATIDGYAKKAMNAINTCNSIEEIEAIGQELRNTADQLKNSILY